MLFLLIAFLLSAVPPSFLWAIGPRSTDSPGARWGHAFIYDSTRNVLVLFGGARERGAYLDDTWTWDGATWQRQNVPGPAARGFAAAAFHARRGTVILHGGRGKDRRTYSDTWEWDGSRWRNIEEEGPFKADHHQMVYMAPDSLMLAFGGWNGQDVVAATWTWEGSWKLASVQGPPKRAAFGMAYDTHAANVTLFGGLWVDGQYADLWEWKDGSWKRQGGPYENSSLDHHAMVYDIGKRQLVIFGGKNYRYVAQNRIQTISGNKVHLLAAEGPKPRHSVGLAYDSHRGQVILYGGKEYQGEMQVPLGDFWTWDDEGWRQLKLDGEK